MKIDYEDVMDESELIINESEFDSIMTPEEFEEWIKQIEKINEED